MGAAGLVLLAIAGPEDISRPLVQLGLPLLLIAGLIYWRVRRWRRRSEQGSSGPYWVNVAKKMWRPRGSGFYALIAAVTFVGLQGEMLLDRSQEVWGTWRDAPYTEGGAFVDFLSGQLWGGVVEVVVAVSIQTILNVVWAGLWPLSWLQRYGFLVAAGAILVTYAIYRGARRRFPQFDTIMRHVDVSTKTDPVPEDTQVEPAQEAFAQGTGSGVLVDSRKEGEHTGAHPPLHPSPRPSRIAKSDTCGCRSR